MHIKHVAASAVLSTDGLDSLRIYVNKDLVELTVEFAQPLQRE